MARANHTERKNELFHFSSVMGRSSLRLTNGYLGMSMPHNGSAFSGQQQR